MCIFLKRHVFQSIILKRHVFQQSPLFVVRVTPKKKQPLTTKSFFFCGRVRRKEECVICLESSILVSFSLGLWFCRFLFFFFFGFSNVLGGTALPSQEAFGDYHNFDGSETMIYISGMMSLVYNSTIDGTDHNDGFLQYQSNVASKDLRKYYSLNPSAFTTMLTKR